jgi:hypothetical protein
MKNLRFYLLLTTIFSSVTLNSQLALSVPTSNTIKYVSTETPLKVNLHNGLGTNISFSDVNQSIETIFLDNKSFVSLNLNGCLSEDNSRSCPPNSAPTLIHLSTIDPLTLPGVTNVNQLAGQNSLLTVITTDVKKQKYTYIFNLNVSNLDEGMPHVALVRIYPKPNEFFENTQLTTPQGIDRLKIGFRLAMMRGDYSPNSITPLRIQRFIDGLNMGDKLESAPSYGLPLSLVSNLIDLGTSKQ